MDAAGADETTELADGGAEFGTAGIDIVASGVSVRGARGPVFENVDVEIPAGGLFVAHGPDGSGRTSLLLTLAGRMRFITGAVRIGGHELPAGGKQVRRLVSLARAEPAVGLEGRLRVRELVSERTWISRQATEPRVTAAFELLGIDPAAQALTEDLDPVTGCLLTVALALAERPRALIVDDVGRGCTPSQRQQVWRALRRVRETGCTVLTSATDPAPGPVPESLSTPVTIQLPRRSADRLSKARDEEKDGPR